MECERTRRSLPFHDFPASQSAVAKDPLKVIRCAEQLKALSEPLRLRIVSALRSGPKSVSDLSEALKVELVTVSHHLQILRNARIVETERKGRFILYSLHEDVFQATESGRASEHLDLGCCRLEIPKESR
jgi:DNA-binding transcriptional ArsR family regulator